jgi:hypothetical protein
VRKHEPALKAQEARECRHTDVVHAFVANDPDYKVEELTLGQWGHYSVRGNAIIAEHLLDYFTRHGLDERSKIRRQGEREVRMSAAAR